MDSRTRNHLKELKEQMEALIIALPKEEASYHFYLRMAKSTEQEDFRMMFHQMAEEELEHKRNLERYIERLGKVINGLKGKADRT